MITDDIISNSYALIVEVPVRNWEDTHVNAVADISGELIPCRRGPLWAPVIELGTGHILNWNESAPTEVRVHYKVTDEGNYWLADQALNKIAKWRDEYVPDHILCTADRGYGDYIIMQIESGGIIKNWVPPILDEQDWNPFK
jgi:hypothetical protein